MGHFPSQSPLLSLSPPLPSLSSQHAEEGRPCLSRGPACGLPIRQPSACSWPVEGLTSAPSPRGRMKTTVTSSGRHPASRSGTWDPPASASHPSLLRDQPAGGLRNRGTNVRVSLHNRAHTLHVCTHPHAHTPPHAYPHVCTTHKRTRTHTPPPRTHTPTHTPPHASGNLTHSAQGVSHTRVRLNASVAADGSQPGPAALREQGHLLLIYTKALAYSLWLWPQPQKNPPPSGFLGLSELWTPRPPPALPTGSPCPMSGPPHFVLVWVA